jgi:hypothetical protein
VGATGVPDLDGFDEDLQAHNRALVVVLIGFDDYHFSAPGPGIAESAPIAPPVSPSRRPLLAKIRRRLTRDRRSNGPAARGVGGLALSNPDANRTPLMKGTRSVRGVDQCEKRLKRAPAACGFLVDVQ